MESIDYAFNNLGDYEKAWNVSCHCFLYKCGEVDRFNNLFEVILIFGGMVIGHLGKGSARWRPMLKNALRKEGHRSVGFCPLYGNANLFE